MIKTAFLAWQDPTSRTWWPIGRLSHEDGVFRFVYTRGAQKSKDFSPLGMFPSLDQSYESDSLFPIFANRLLPATRPEYRDFVTWLNIPHSEHDPVAILSRTGGLRATDSLEMFPCPEPLPSGEYVVHFFVRGIRHLPQPIVSERVSKLAVGERLYLLADIQNQHDPLALAIRSSEPVLIIGYCPRYLTPDANALVHDGSESIVKVERVNVDAPYQLRLLCSLTTSWPDGFVPCSSELYQPLASLDNPVRVQAADEATGPASH